MNAPARLFRASILYGLSGFVGKAGALLTVPVVARSLGPADYGLLDLAVSMIGLATMVGGLSAELPVARLVTKERRHEAAIFTTYMAVVAALSGAIAVAIAGLGEPIARDIWRRVDAAPIVFVSAAAVALYGVQLATWNVHRIRDRPRAVAALSVADMVLKVSFIWAAAIAGLGARGIVSVYFVLAGLGAAIGMWTIRKDLAVSLLPRSVPTMIRGGALFTVMAVAFVVSNYAVRALIAAESGALAVGAMALGLKVASVLALPLRGFQLAWAPPNIAGSQSPASRRRFVRSIVAALVLGTLAATTLGAFAPEVVHVVGGSDYVSAAHGVPGLAMATTLAAVFFMIGVACSVAGIPVWKAGLAAVVGAAVQIIVTDVVLVLLDAQPAVGLGAVVGQAAAIGALVQMSGSRALADRSMVVVLTVVAVLAVVLLQLVLSVPTPILRWTVGLMAAAVLALASIRALRLPGSVDKRAKSATSFQE